MLLDLLARGTLFPGGGLNRLIYETKDEAISLQVSSQL